MEAFSGSPTGTASPGRARSTPAAAPARLGAAARARLRGHWVRPVARDARGRGREGRLTRRAALRGPAPPRQARRVRPDHPPRRRRELPDRAGRLDIRGCADRPGTCAPAALVFDANTLATYRSFFRETFALEAPGLVMLGAGTPERTSSPIPGARVSGRVQRVRDGGCARPAATSSVITARCRRPGLHRRRRPRCLAVYGQDPAVNFDAALDELRHSKAIYLVTREGQGRR